MTIKDLLENFGTKTPYTIINVDNPHDIIWQGKGNKLTKLCDKSIVYGVEHTTKQIVIYTTRKYI